LIAKPIKSPQQKQASIVLLAVLVFPKKGIHHSVLVSFGQRLMDYGPPRICKLGRQGSVYSKSHQILQKWNNAKIKQMRIGMMADASTELTVAYHRNQKTMDVANVGMGVEHSD
jgi:hypothetical protein